MSDLKVRPPRERSEEKRFNSGGEEAWGRTRDPRPTLRRRRSEWGTQREREQQVRRGARDDKFFVVGLGPIRGLATTCATREGAVRRELQEHRQELEGVDGVADYYAVDVGYVYAAVGGGVFEDLRFQAGVAYRFGKLFAWAEESGDVLNAHAAF